MKLRIALPVAVLIAASAPAGALAAPQILAVLPTETAIAFQCADGVCEIELSAYCLQRDRAAPAPGTAYGPAARGQFTLVLRADERGERRLAAERYVSFSGRRSYTAVVARLPEGVLAAFGATSARIEVAANASLVPAPRAGDPEPLSQEEVAEATGPLRALGARLVDERPAGEAAGVLAAMINVLPSYDPVAPERRAGLWREVTGEADAASPGLARARAEYEGCLEAIADQSVYALRGCLERRHDGLLRDLNDDYWNAPAGT